MSQESRSQARTLQRAAQSDHSSWLASLGLDLSSVWEGSPDDVSPNEFSSEPLAVAVAVAVAVSEDESSSEPIALAVDDRQALQPVLEELLAFDGSIGVALVDSQSGMVLGEAGSANNLGLSAAGASEILRARLETNKALGNAEEIVDVLITLSSQLQIIHPLSQNSKLFVYLIGDKTKSSLAMARYKAAEADKNLRL